MFLGVGKGARRGRECMLTRGTIYAANTKNWSDQLNSISAESRLGLVLAYSDILPSTKYTFPFDEVLIEQPISKCGWGRKVWK